MATDSKIVVHDFAHSLLDKIVHFKIVHLDQSLFIWVGTNPAVGNMAVAMPAKDNSVPVSSVLFGNKSELSTPSLAQKLSKRLSKQVFLSCSVPYDQHLSPLIEQTLAKELSSQSQSQTSS